VNGLNRLGLLSLLDAGLRSIRTRAWLILGGAGFVLTGLVAWAGIALLSWAWAQAPVVVDAGKQLGGEVTTQIEQTAPGWTERLDQWLPGLRTTLERWVPGLARPPAQDVSGTDIGPVPRYPGLVRSHFARDASGVEVAYIGRAAMDSVVAHYVKGFTASGFAHEVMAASPDSERHRFRQAQETFEFSVARRAGGLIEVRLKQLAPAPPPVRR